MNARNILPLATAAAPAAPVLLTALAPLIPYAAIGLVAGAFIAWAFTDDEVKESPDKDKPSPEVPPKAICPRTVTRCLPSPPVRVIARPPAPRSVTPAPRASRVLDLPTPKPSLPPASSSLGNPKPPAATPALTSRAVAEPAKPKPRPFVRKVTKEQLAAIFAAGPISRQQATAALMAAGLSKSRAYAVLQAGGNYAAHLIETPDGALSWKV